MSSAVIKTHQTNENWSQTSTSYWISFLQQSSLLSGSFWPRLIIFICFAKAFWELQKKSTILQLPIIVVQLYWPFLWMPWERKKGSLSIQNKKNINMPREEPNLTMASHTAIIIWCWAGKEKDDPTIKVIHQEAERLSKDLSFYCQVPAWPHSAHPTPAACVTRAGPARGSLAPYGLTSLGGHAALQKPLQRWHAALLHFPEILMLAPHYFPGNKCIRVH